MRKLFVALAIAGASASFTLVRAEEPAKKADQMPSCPIDPKAGAALDRIKALAGTWIAAAPAPGAPEMKIVFQPTAGGSAVMETMFPGSDHEMVNLFTANDKTILLTHYCVQGVQPRMKLASGDEATMKFEFVDGGNIKSRNDPHMDAVAITVTGDKLTEEWSFYSDGKVTERKVFEFTRQPQAAK